MNSLTYQEPHLMNKQGQVFTTSIDVAEKFGKRHDRVIRKIKEIIGSNLPKNGEIDNKQIDEFNRLNFKSVTYLDDRGRRQPMYLMTRSGFSILAMGFTGKEALEWKIKYEAAFRKMEEVIRRQQTTSWLDTRNQGKAARLAETDRIRQFIEYAEAQGSKNAHYYYKHITTATYKALFIIRDKGGKSFRDLLDSMQLSFLQTAEYVAANALADGMASNLHYKDIYKLAKSRIETFAGTIP